MKETQGKDTEKKTGTIGIYQKGTEEIGAIVENAQEGAVWKDHIEKVGTYTILVGVLATHK